VVAAAKARWLLVSFNDEGYLSLDLVREILGAEGEVREMAIEHPRYIGHRIGIYNPQGERVGEPGHARNHEHLFRVDRAAAPARVAKGRAVGSTRRAAVAAP
jgi:adenine-specific DNA-methyltransferase